MKTTPTPYTDVPCLVTAQGPSLEETVSGLAELAQRRRHYDDLTRRRDLIEPTVNAFERRFEECPSSVQTPLNGLPITVKDQVAVEGWPRSFGLERLSKRPDKTSASLVARLTALGAVVTAKTALPPNAMDFQTANAQRGPTRNPHNPSFTAGGSTGGGAAAVASGMSLLDVGADLSGSLRIPAAWCGVCSYVPSEGFWPNDGLLRGTQRLSHFARIGLTARSTIDLGYIWHALETGAEAPASTTHTPRVAIWSPGLNAPCDTDTLTAWRTLVQSLGTRAIDPTLHEMSDLLQPRVYQFGGEILGHITGALVPTLIRWLMRRDRAAAEASPGFVSHIHTGYKRDQKRYKDNLEHLHALRAEAERDWANYDALLLPVTGVCAFEHITPTKDQNGVRSYDAVFETGAGPMGYFDAMTRFTLPLTVLGWPVVTLPIGRDSNGLPIGGQLIGKPNTDERLLSLASEIQAALL